MRLDKWLWAARFFKTRPLAAEAINGGKVQLNGQRTKPGKIVRPGVRLRIQKGPLRWEIRILALAKQRRPASEAALLYEEEASSRRERQEIVQQRRQAGIAPPSRPNKRDRRRIQQLRNRAAY